MPAEICNSDVLTICTTLQHDVRGHAELWPTGNGASPKPSLGLRFSSLFTPHGRRCSPHGHPIATAPLTCRWAERDFGRPDKLWTLRLVALGSDGEPNGAEYIVPRARSVFFLLIYTVILKNSCYTSYS